MLHKATSIKESSSLRGDFRTYMERRSDNKRTSIFWLAQDFNFSVAWEKLIDVSQILLNPKLLERNINLWGNSYNTVSFSQHRPLSLTPSFRKQAGTSSTLLCEFILTPHCQREPIHNPPTPPPFKKPLLLCSPQLGSPFLSKEPDWGLGSVLWPK